ncbi:hypothetical protein Tco_1274599 [Tanacetum coccineum]
MSNMSEDIQYAGSDTRPPMLDRTDFESWQQRIRLYCLGKDNGENIMKSITEGPFQMGTFIQTHAEDAEETDGALQLGPERARVFTDLFAKEKERYKADIRATNILLQGIPKDIYTLINHYTDAKDIWDNVKMILEGSELTKDDRESQLYDEFERFCQIKGETIHVYYVRFSKLINDMRNIKMTMSRMQLNSKFVNNMLPEWSRFITEVKLNRGVQTTLFKEVKVMEEIFDQMSGEVDQNTVDKQCAEIVKKNLLIENENLIANCLSNQLLYDVENTLLDLELRVNTSTEASGSKPRSNTKNNRILPAKSVNNKKVEDHPRTNKSVWTKVNRVDSSISSKRVVINSNSESVSVNSTPTVKIVWNKGKQIWKPKGKLSDNSLNKTKRVWKATGGTDIPLVYDSGYSKHMTGNRSKLKNFVEKFIGIYNKRTRRIMETIHVTFDEMHQTMAPVRISSGPEPIMMTPGQLNSGLAPLPILATTYIPPIDKDLEILFQPMFDEYFDQSTNSKPVPMATVVNAPIVSTNTSVSTTITQDAPSTSHLLSFSQVHPPVFPQGVAVGPTIKDTSITQADLHPLVNPVVGEPSSAQLNSGDSNQDFKMAVIETAGSSHAKMKFTNLINLKYGKFSTVAQIYVIVARIEAIEYSVPMLKPSKFDIYQLDVKTAFRMVFFKEEVFVSVSQKD